MSTGDASSRRAVSEQVALRIQADIIEGRFRPGDRLPTERELAERLNVNRSSVREALRRLEQLRLVRIQQGSGIRVLAPEEASFDLVWQLLVRGGRPDVRWIGALLELREMLMPGVLRLALARAQPVELDVCCRLLESAADPELPADAFVQAVQSFQIELVRATRNRVLVLLANALRRGLEERELRLITRALGDQRAELGPCLLALARCMRAGEHVSAERALGEVLQRLNAAIASAWMALAMADAKPEDAPSRGLSRGP